MSLTSHLKDPKSPVRRFMEERFADTRRVVGSTNALLRTAHTITPPALVGTYPYADVGHAIDYRLRYYFAVTPSEELVAWRGARIGNVVEDLLERTDTATEFFASLDAELARMNPVRKRLDRTDEERLARYCYALGLYEVIYRTGEAHAGLRAAHDTKDLLTLAPPEAVEDLMHLSYAFYDGYSGLLELPTTLNPTFDGSGDVGGADADFVVDGCLLDIKATIKPRLDKLWLYQLLGYVLLDYSDAYGISEVGIYYARQATEVRWDLRELIELLGGPDTPDLAVLREQFREVASSVRPRRTRP